MANKAAESRLNMEMEMKLGKTEDFHATMPIEQSLTFYL